MTYTRSTLDQPNLSNPTLASGGSLEPNTTYYYKVIAISGTEYRIWQVGNYYSLPSNEVSITTDDTNKTVVLDWGDITNADQYAVYRSKVSGVYTTMLWKPPQITTSNFTDDGTYNPSGYTNLAPYDVKLNGYLKISDEGSSDVPITLEDIYNEDVANGWDIIEKLDFGIYEIHCFLEIAGSVYFNTENETLIINGGLIFNSHCTVGRKLKENSYANGCSFIFKRVHKFSQVYGSYIYDSKFFAVLDGLSSYAIHMQAFYIQQGAQFEGNICEGFRGVYFEDAGTSAKNLILNTNRSSEGQSIFGIANPNSLDIVFENIIVSGFSTGIQLESGSAGKFKGLTLVGNNKDIYGYRNTANPVVVDTTFSTLSMSRSDTSQDGTISIKYTFNLKVTDKNNVAIKGAAINFKSSNGKINLSLTTASDGTIAEQELFDLIYSIPSGGTGYYYNYQSPYLDEDNYNPYTLTISKPGYQTYQEEITVDRKIDWMIALEKVKISVDQEVLI